MGKVRARKETGKLYFDFVYMGKRCREQTALEDTPANRRRVGPVMKRVDAEIAAGVFNYRANFPNSKIAAKFEPDSVPVEKSKDSSGKIEMTESCQGNSPTFGEFSETWLAENEVRWRRTTRGLRRDMIRSHLFPRFGEMRVGQVTRAELLEFRADLAKRRGKQPGTTISPKTVNEVMGVLSNIIDEAADRYEFVSPAQRIKRLKVPRKDIQPFNLDQALRIINTARADYRHYFVTRFFTGMRSGEVHGLKWNFVDFDRRQILVRETFTHGEQDGTKTDGSMREITMSEQVFDALKAQHDLTGHLGEYVFSSRNGMPIDLANFVSRVWNPLLDHLALKRRRPYQMRHTAATLWLASGENPEWIARQLGHSTTEMLFRVYSRYVPNLTRRDGSAFENMLKENAVRNVEERK
jgi:integrase